MLFALQINADGCYDAVPRKELAIDHQHQQILGHRPFHQLLQIPGCGCFPMPANAGSFDAVTLQTAIHGSFIVTAGALAAKLANHRSLHLAVALKGFVAGELNLLVVRATQTWPLQIDFAPVENDIPRLLPMSPDRLLSPATGLLFDLRPHNTSNDDQPYLGREAFDILVDPGDQFFHGQLSFQHQFFSIGSFFFGLFNGSAVFSHRWFSWLIVHFFQPSILFDERQENQLPISTTAGTTPSPLPIQWEEPLG